MTHTPIGDGKVSIVIPCYNHGAMLREALASIEQVRNANLLEVLVGDDSDVQCASGSFRGNIEERSVARPRTGTDAGGG